MDQLSTPCMDLPSCLSALLFYVALKNGAFMNQFFFSDAPLSIKMFIDVFCLHGMYAEQTCADMDFTLLELFLYYLVFQHLP